MAALPCIYCRRTDVPRTREHVLQAALKAPATLPDAVCADCNATFSPLDKAFVDALGFHHTGHAPFRSLGLGRMKLPNGTVVAARLRSDGHGEFLPQLYEDSDGAWHVLCSKDEDTDVLLTELSSPDGLRVRTEVVPPVDGVPRLSVLRSAPRTYLVRGLESGAVERLASVLRSKGLSFVDRGPTTRSVDPTPSPIQYDTSLHLDPYCRAMAKVALNWVCYRLGVEAALAPEFDAIRAYARFGDGHFADFVVPTLLNHDIEDALAAFISEKQHAIYLAKADGIEAVFLGINGTSVGRVDLTRDSNPGLPKGTWLLTRFEPDTRTHVDLTLPKDFPRAVLNPKALGFDAVWPQEWLHRAE